MKKTMNSIHSSNGWRNGVLTTLILTTTLSVLSTSTEAPKTERLPNFVIIFTDDQGYGDIGCFGSPTIKTPRLDRMAREGRRFTSFYVAAPVCTPSRAALMTGCYPQRVSLPTVLFPRDRIGINDDETTVAEVLKTRGYATACIGKWHLGHLPPFLPTRHGFDRYFGIPYSNDMNPAVLMRNEDIIENPAVQTTLTERYTQEAIKFITENKNRPFFLYLPHTMPHTPLHVSERFAGKSKRGLYGDVIECLDWSTGQILDTLDELGLDKNTLVIYTTDNGPWYTQGVNGGSAGPLRGAKATTFEGGMRVPCIMRWPGRIPPATVCMELTTSMDLLPTLAGLAGAKLPTDRIIDGKDVWPLMAGQPGAKDPNEAFFYYRGYRLEAVRSGKWKLSFERGAGKRTLPENRKNAPESLYDLEVDPSEKYNVIDKHGDVAVCLRELAEQMREDLGDTITRRAGRNRRPAGEIKP